MKKLATLMDLNGVNFLEFRRDLLEQMIRELIPYDHYLNFGTRNDPLSLEAYRRNDIGNFEEKI